MIIYPIHNLKDQKIFDLLAYGLSEVEDERIIKNYHPAYRGHPGNLFTILDNDRYSFGVGTYYIMEENKKYVCSAGWNIYPDERSTALILSRMYTKKESRSNFLIGNYILPLCIGESMQYAANLWMTFNLHNEIANRWFAKCIDNLNVPPLYKKFKHIGVKNVYNTTQYVYQWIP